ncbi:MAG: TonB-dependent receptor [Gammaproteobacteria bacterium AqS3]|nr:TonB-dependent receptor [Gammaproteobacteria bacterium AqS3]
MNTNHIKPEANSNCGCHGKTLCAWHFLLAVTMAAAYGLPASAQNSETGAEEIEEVLVVGKRRAYRGNFDDMEKPAADQTLGEELLREAGVISLDDALDLSGSVSRQNNFGGLWNSFSIRGFAGDLNLPSGFLVNGFNAGRGFAGPRDMVGIETVEILKGPRSALFGRGEPGGTINLITKRPQFESGREIRATLGEWSQVRIEGDVQTTGSIGSNTDVGLRLVGFNEDAESFRETVETQKTGFYPSITLRNSAETSSLTYEIEYTDQEIPFDRGAAYSEKYGFTPRETFVGEPGDGPIKTEVFGQQLELEHNFSDSWSLLAGLGYRSTSFEGNAHETNFTGRQTYFLDGKTLSRFFRYRNFESDYTVARAEFAGDFEVGSARHRLIIGADYDEFKLSWFILRYRGCWIGDVTDVADLDAEGCLSLNVFNPVYGQFAQPAPGPNTNREEDMNGFGIYIQDQMDLTDRLQLRFGLRWDDFEHELTNLRNSPATTAISSDSRISPQLGAVYAVNDGVSLYFSYGEGFRQQAGSDYQGRQFEPNLTEATEIGVKMDMAYFSDAVSGSLNLAYFMVDQSNILVNDDRPAAQQAGWFSLDAGAAESSGLEVDLSLASENGFNLWLSYTYTDAVFTTSNPDADWGATIEKGDPMINSPEQQLSVQLSQSFELGSMSAQAGGGLQHTGERQGWTGFDFTLPSYTTIRLFGQLQSSERLTLRFDLDNALDEEFYTNSYANVWVGVGAPRRWRLSAAYSF